MDIHIKSGDEDVAKLVDTYLNTNDCGNRSFGYHARPKELNEQGIEYKTIPGIVSIRISKCIPSSFNPSTRIWIHAIIVNCYQ